MKNLLIDLSGKIDKGHIEVISAIKKAADSMGILFFMIGASARDYIFEHQYGVKSIRKTNDIDIGVNVASWDRFKELKKILIEQYNFEETKIEQRLKYKRNPVDIVPYGDIASSDHSISWPPEFENVMSVVGFEEAYNNSLTVKLNKYLEVKIVSLPGLAALKLISWDDKYPNRKKDAEDIRFIIDNYETAGNFDRLYAQEREILEQESFDNTLAAIRLLGKDMLRILNNDTQDKIKNILERETREDSKYQLVSDMMKHGNDFEETLRRLEKFKSGFVEN